jgi:hypothetical protein
MLNLVFDRPRDRVGTESRVFDASRPGLDVLGGGA